MNGRAFRVEADGSVAAIEAGAACAASIGEAPLTWLHLDGREAETAAWLAAQPDLPAPVVSALTAAETRPRCEAIGDGALVNLRGLGLTPDDDPDPLVSIRLWVMRGRVVSVSFRRLAAIPPLVAELERGAIRDPGDLVATLARLITAALDPEVAAIGDTLDVCEETLDVARAYQQRRTIAAMRSQAIGYRRFVAPQCEALAALAALPLAWLEDDDRLHLREAADRFARMAEELEAIRERSALLHEQLTDLRAEQTEMRTLLLSVVALVFLPLTFVTGLLGINVAGIPFAGEPWAFGAVLGLCLAAAALISGYFIRAHWFR